MKKLFSLFIIFSLLFSVSCTQQEPVKGVESSMSETGQIKTIKVTSDVANVRSGCSNDAAVLSTPNKNQTLNVVSQVENWYAVQLPDKSIGFVSADQCKPIVAETGGKSPSQSPGAGTTPGANGNGATTPGVNGEGQGTTPENNGTNNGANTPDANTDNNTLTNEEQQMLDLVNQVRTQHGLNTLKADMELTNVARIKSQDMIDNNYFSHHSPTYGDPFDMMKDFGISYVKAAENIAGNQNVQSAHDALMNSPGHRKNILDPDFTHIGIGIRNGGQYGNMFTQMFVSRPQ